MTSLLQTLSSIRHRPGRTLLTAIGTALGIATIVALLAVGAGAQRSAGQFFHLGPADFGLFQKDAADPTTSVLPTSMIPKLERLPGVASATPFVLIVEAVPHNPGVVVFGATPHNFQVDRMVFSAGHMYTNNHEAVIGNGTARQMHVGVGDTLTVKHHKLRIVGIYHIGVAYEDTGAFIPLPVAQSITGRQDEATTIPVLLKVGARPKQVKHEIERHFSGLTVLTDSDESLRLGANGDLVSKAALVIAVLALVIGGIGVMNTELMAVIERRSEFALLSAVGWSGRQIAWRVLVEGVVTTVIGAAIGLLLGVIGAHYLVKILGASEFVSPHITAWALGRALLIGVLIGVLGGLYPAWRAAHVSPARVLAQH
ncbi:MAG TPA: ABC transporter permease [Solirubrobacteraceae bacterium]|nr:ABC transporter permease [Solirubrobacteraceae bacterium]